MCLPMEIQDKYVHRTPCKNADLSGAVISVTHMSKPICAPIFYANGVNFVRESAEGAHDTRSRLLIIGCLHCRCGTHTAIQRAIDLARKIHFTVSSFRPRQSPSTPTEHRPPLQSLCKQASLSSACRIISTNTYRKLVLAHQFVLC